MMPATNRGAGMNIGFPDPCLTMVGLAPAPLPYPNLAPHAMTLGFSMNVFVSGVNALNLASKVALTSGHEAGNLHPLYKQAGMFVVGNPIVFVNKVPGICLLCPTMGNSGNNPLGAVLVPSVTNVFYTHLPEALPAPAADDPFARDMGFEELDDLLRSLASVGREVGAPVEAAMRVGGVGHVAIRVFSADVPARVHFAIQTLLAQGMEELVLDLRDNPGGDATAFAELAGDFLEPGSVVVTRIDADGDETVIRSSQERPHRFPLTIVVNRRTASAAELFAGCLAAHGRAIVVGERTYGKGVGQEIVVSASGAARAVTTVRYRLPDGREVQGAGVEPGAGDRA
jgi:carboxyl-terminal processing protease